LCEETDYQVAGRITSAERWSNTEGKLYDRIQFQFDVSLPAGEPVARSVITWHYTRDTL
jgi:hypothetical protein